MLPWKLRKRQILPVNQNLSSVYFSLAKFQLVSCNLSLAMIWQMNTLTNSQNCVQSPLKVYILPTLKKLTFVQAVLNTVVYQMLIVYTNVLVNSAVLFKQ